MHCIERKKGKVKHIIKRREKKMLFKPDSDQSGHVILLIDILSFVCDEIVIE